MGKFGINNKNQILCENFTWNNELSQHKNGTTISPETTNGNKEKQVTGNNFKNEHMHNVLWTILISILISENLFVENVKWCKISFSNLIIGWIPGRWS